ncbi:unnamed protein product [Ixodes pacificus]
MQRVKISVEMRTTRDRRWILFTNTCRVATNWICPGNHRYTNWHLIFVCFSFLKFETNRNSARSQLRQPQSTHCLYFNRSVALILEIFFFGSLTSVSCLDRARGTIITG